VKKSMDYDVESVQPRGQPKKTLNDIVKKTLSDPTTMQGRCYGP